MGVESTFDHKVAATSRPEPAQIEQHAWREHVREGNLAAGFIRRAVLALPGIPHCPETGSCMGTDLTGCAGGFGSAVAGFGGVVRIFPAMFGLRPTSRVG
jgi:hypothetical protein